MAAPKFLRNVAGVITEIIAAVVATADSIVATDSTGRIDISFMPTGIGPDTQSVLASEAIAAGKLVNVYNNAGTLNVRNADASAATATKRANGFVLAPIASGASGLVYFGGINTAVTGLTPGGPLYLSDVSPGGILAAAPTTSAHTVQDVGVALSATSMQFEPQSPLVLA